MVRVKRVNPDREAMVPIGQYVQELNAFEQWLNVRGATRRDGAFAGRTGGRIAADLPVRFRLGDGLVFDYPLESSTYQGHAVTPKSQEMVCK